MGTAGFMVVAVMIVMSLLAEVIAPYDPELIDVEVMLTPPGPEFWLGIDQFGRGRHNQWLP
ncbi:MAG: hypothetical protein O7D91_00170 [Planctomycetota bacterium]|nr:hypothetical protein [Planctomycetota bacterium]